MTEYQLKGRVVSVAATGDIQEDLPAIRKIIQDVGNGDMHFNRHPWWGEPASEEAIRSLTDQFGELPQDVIDFYRVTNIATFARFDAIMAPQAILERAKHGVPYSEADHIDAPWLFENNVPTGAILPMSLQEDWGCLIELSGPDHGRVMSPSSGDRNYFRTLAWSLSDAVACSRELYEFGWYQNDGVRGDIVKPKHDDALLARIQPILDKWNCNPLLAMFHNPYGYEPERPTNR